jgi:hypothetical protein
MYIHIVFLQQKLLLIINSYHDFISGGHRDSDRMQSVPITTDVVSSNLDHVEMYNIM